MLLICGYFKYRRVKIMGMPDFDKELNFENTQAEYAQNLVIFLSKHLNGNFVAKVRNTFAQAFAFSPVAA